MYDPEGMWRRRIILGLVGVVVILLAGGTGFLIARGGSDNPTNETDQDPGAQPAPPPQSSSVCGLPDGDQEVPTIGPEAEWTAVDDLLMPSTEQYGPGEESDDIHSCFARNPTGALLAAAAYLADRNNVGVDQGSFAAERFARGEGYDDQVREYGRGNTYDAPAGTEGQFAGFRFTQYSSSSTALEIAFRVTSLEQARQAPYLSVPVELVWQDGDWKQVATDDGTVNTPADLDGYVVWAAEPEVESPQSTGRGLDDAAAAAHVQRTAISDVGGFGMSPPVLLADELPGDESSSPPAGDVDRESPSGNAPDGQGEDAGGACENVISLKCAGEVLIPDLPSVPTPGGIASGIAGSALQEFAATAQEAAEWAIEELLTAWLNYPDPNVQAENSAAKWLQNNLAGLVVFAVMFSVIVSAIRLVVVQRFEHMRDLAGHLIRVLLVGGLTLVVVGLGVRVGDELTGWLLDQTEIDLGGGGAALLGVTAGLTNSILVIVIGLFIVLAQIIQLALMVIRTAVVTFLAGALPLAAAASQTQAGKQSYQKMLTWLAAFVLYKPAAALVYVMAIRMTNSDQDIASRFAGLGLMVLAIVALPALLRLFVPITASIGSTSGGGLALAGVGAAVATGAMLAGGAAAGGAGAAAGGAGANAAPTGGTPGGGSGGGGHGGGGGGVGPPQGSSSGGRSSAGGTTAATPQIYLQPVGAAPPSESDQQGTQAPQHEASPAAGTGASAGASAGAAPARGADERAGGGADLRIVDAAIDGASRGAATAGGVTGAASGAVDDSRMTGHEENR